MILSIRTELVTAAFFFSLLASAPNSTRAAQALQQENATCGAQSPFQCATFNPADLSGNTYPLKNGTQIRVVLEGIAGTSPWDTHAPVVLDAPPDDGTACPPSMTAMNQPGSVLFVQTYTDGQQWLYLVFNGIALQRQLMPSGLQPDVKWLKASALGTDDDPNDYFVEFASTSGSIKLYRVEAFPHLADGAPPQTACDLERPDQQALIGSVQRQYARRTLTAEESSSGNGTEPTH